MKTKLTMVLTIWVWEQAGQAWGLDSGIDIQLILINSSLPGWREAEYLLRISKAVLHKVGAVVHSCNTSTGDIKPRRWRRSSKSPSAIKRVTSQSELYNTVKKENKNHPLHKLLCIQMSLSSTLYSVQKAPWQDSWSLIRQRLGTGHMEQGWD